MIAEFAASEATNFDLCKIVNQLLKDAVIFEKEQSVLEGLLEKEQRASETGRLAGRERSQVLLKLRLIRIKVN